MWPLLPLLQCKKERKYRQTNGLISSTINNLEFIITSVRPFCPTWKTTCDVFVFKCLYVGRIKRYRLWDSKETLLKHPDSTEKPLKTWLPWKHQTTIKWSNIEMYPTIIFSILTIIYWTLLDISLKSASALSFSRPALFQPLLVVPIQIKNISLLKGRHFPCPN